MHYPRHEVGQQKVRHDAGYMASVARQLIPDLITILDCGAVDMLEVDFREVDQEFDEVRHDGDQLHQWRSQNAIVDMLKATLRCSKDQAERYVLQYLCFPRLRARCNKVRKLAADLRQQEAAK